MGVDVAESRTSGESGETMKKKKKNVCVIYVNIIERSSIVALRFSKVLKEREAGVSRSTLMVLLERIPITSHM